MIQNYCFESELVTLCEIAFVFLKKVSEVCAIQKNVDKGMIIRP